MIKITRMSKEYEVSLNKLLLEAEIEDDLSLVYDTMFVVLDNNHVLGFGYYNTYDHKIFIDQLYIKRSERMQKLGDSLFRAILNANVLEGKTHIYMRDLPIYQDFMRSEELFADQGLYSIDLYEFFDRKCKGSKENNLH